MIIETKKLLDLKPAPYNPRSSTKEQEKHLQESLRKFGVVEPIIFNKQTWYIVGGHFRVRELKKLGYKEVECVIVDLNEADEKELNIRLNANTGEWDFDELANWNADELSGWGIEIEEKITLKIEDKQIKPFNKTHILFSFPPEKLIEIQEYIEKIKNIEGVEYEQASN